MSKPKAKIFLSYAHEDIAMAKRLYQDINRYGLDVWIDCENLLPGQNWKITIEKNIKQSQFYLLLLSSHSMTKRGFIQKEMKIAYEVLENCAEDDIYLIPVRLNNCEPSFKISDIQYIDVFPETEYKNGLKKILQVVSPGTFIIRNVPKELSSVDVNEMLKMHGYYDNSRNPGGKGILHNYELRELKGSKVVIDKPTCLMWQKDGSSEGMIFEDVKKYIIELNQKKFGGFADWRFPTLEEAMSLMESEDNEDLYFNIDPMFDIKQEAIWTADQVYSESAAWVIDFAVGFCDWDTLDSDYFVRAVRTGQSDKSD